MTSTGCLDCFERDRLKERRADHHRFLRGEAIDDRPGRHEDPVAHSDVGDEQGRGATLAPFGIDRGALRIDRGDSARKGHAHG